ncbi:MAG: hypothetical protein U0176_12825 [Bacteroidia bacterium]
MKRMCMVAAILPVVQAMAGGFQVNLQSVAQYGARGRGLGIRWLGAVLQSRRIGLHPRASARASRPSWRASATSPPARTTTPPPTSGIYHRHAYANYRYKFGADNAIALGAAVYTPSAAVGVSYADDWRGQFALREIAQTIFIQPTIGLKLGNRFGIGGGPVFATGDVLLRRGVPAQFMDGSYGRGEALRKRQGHGLQCRGHVQCFSLLSFGISYRPPSPSRRRTGQATFTVPSALAQYFPNTTFTGAIALPATATIGSAYKPNNKHIFGLDVNYVF